MYWFTISKPKKIYITADKDMKGLNDIRSFLSLILMINKINDTTAPKANEQKIMNNTPFVPNISPTTIINFISPPPMACVKRAIAKNDPNPINAPVILSTGDDLVIAI